MALRLKKVTTPYGAVYENVYFKVHSVAYDDTDGILYASGADLVGYTHQSDFDELTITVNNIDDEIESWTNQYGIIAC